MDTTIIPVILQRVKAYHDVQYAWIIIHADESWHIKIVSNFDSAVLGEEEDRIVANGNSFSELPAYLSSLK